MFLFGTLDTNMSIFFILIACDRPDIGDASNAGTVAFVEFDIIEGTVTRAGGGGGGGSDSFGPRSAASSNRVFECFSCCSLKW